MQLPKYILAILFISGSVHAQNNISSPKFNGTATGELTWTGTNAFTGITTITSGTLALTTINTGTISGGAFVGDGSGLTDMTKSQVGLGNVDNTSDATKDAATATLTNKTLTSPVINTPTGLVKGDVGLGSADNTSDADKPVSTDGQTALDLKLDESQASSFGLTLLDDADATAGRATLGLVIGTNVLAPAGNGSALTDMIWSQIGSTPTTLSGYGITDAVGTGGSRADLTGGSGSLDLAAFTLGLPADVTRLGSSIDLASEVTGTLPGSEVQLSATGNAGVVTEATDGEVQTGTGSKNVVVSSLAAWWTWVKTQAWSWSGAQTYTGNTTLGDASGDTVTINAGTVTAPNATDTSDNSIANVGAIKAVVLTGANTMPERGEIIGRGNGSTPSNPGLMLFRGYIDNLADDAIGTLVGDGQLPSRLVNGRLSLNAGGSWFEGWGGGSSGTIVTGSLNVTIRSQQYNVTLASALSLSRGDVLTGNVTGATGEVYFLDGSAGPTSTASPAIRPTNGILFTTADTNVEVNAGPSGVGVSTTSFGNVPAAGMYIYPAPVDLSLTNAFDLKIINNSGLSKDVIFEFLRIN